MKGYFICQGLQKSYGQHVVLPGVDMALAQGSITALIGASGCGKSTFLQLAAGFIPLDAGSMLLDGRPCNGPGPGRVMVFQEDALFPWLNVQENVELGLKIGCVALELRKERVREMLALVGLEAWEKSLPSALSGGMRQRVALARALVLRPKLLLLDEPFAALDAITRARMQRLLAELQLQTGVTVLLVTHDVSEACLLADSIHLMGTGLGIVATWTVDVPRPRHPDNTDFAQMKAEMRAQLEAVM
ncbi:ABC transporter ATP-binding protein [Desulfovibrio intestinalis]|uniref:ABC-type nitrate/sulfonate/bicarbonate transport system ATPase subunit n=1 Tax=Desulfovibrio intestinalis TaxID=58621 RepID=A0A7W8FH41_9BACT|nr:ABC transporter ATP-binding protein [Desulfovibrio intestinalis]MBB5144470.1 ABC-type nitrate/sulfonate/bicarbonate transport system ATPase subunit [Desulfovibrio intestinalis]